MDQFITLIVAVWLMIAGLAYMVGGKKLASKVVMAPLKFAWKLSAKLLKATARGLARLLKAGFRRLFRLPTPPPQRRLPQRRP